MHSVGCSSAPGRYSQFRTGTINRHAVLGCGGDHQLLDEFAFVGFDSDRRSVAVAYAQHHSAAVRTSFAARVVVCIPPHPYACDQRGFGVGQVPEKEKIAGFGPEGVDMVLGA